MKHFFTTLALFAVTVSASFAQKSDPAAKKVLDEVSAKFKTYKNVKANFTLTIENAQGKVNGKKTGSVVMKATKYRISLQGQDIYSDGNNTWTYDKASNEVKIDKVDQSSTAITPQKVFTNFYDKDFLYKLNGDVKDGGKTVQEIEMTPVDKSKPFFKVLVYVDKANKNIVSTKVFEKNGNHYTYAISGFTPNSPTVTDAQFVFNEKSYPGVEVVDLR